MSNKIEINLKALVNSEWLAFISSQSMDSKKGNTIMCGGGGREEVIVRKYQLVRPF